MDSDESESTLKHKSSRHEDRLVEFQRIAEEEGLREAVVRRRRLAIHLVACNQCADFCLITVGQDSLTGSELQMRIEELL